LTGGARGAGAFLVVPFLLETFLGTVSLLLTIEAHLSLSTTTTSGLRVVGFIHPYPLSSLTMRLSNDPSVFDITNYFHFRWFLDRDWLIASIGSAQRSESG
jgi:hypothetical protein